MPTKVNFVLDDDVKADLDRLVEAGKRSRVINEALRREIVQIRREQANQRLDDLRQATTRRTTASLVSAIRRDRSR